MLTGTQQAEFAKRDVVALESAFSRLPLHWKNGSWLGKNKYAVRGIDQLTKDLTLGKQVTHKQLAEYIAASAVTHCIDGWAYFGRSLNAILSGDHNCARHLGYYAELRATMAFLATEGIGVFDKEHIAVSKLGRCVKFSPNRSSKKPHRPLGIGTHQFVWDALTEWVNSSNSSSVLNTLITAGGSPLTVWLSHFGNIPALSQQLAKDWLFTWGLDISRLASDREARNIASYRPTAFSSPASPTARDIVQAVQHAWQACEPQPGNPFATLDRILIRAAIRKAFIVGHNQSPRKAKKQFQLRVQSILNGVAPNGPPHFDWEEFLTSDAENSPFDPLVLASGKATPMESIHCLQVTFRALLLLRVATGAARRLVNTLPGESISHLDFWVESVGTEGGLWSPSEKPQLTSDLWLDIENSLSDLMGSLENLDSFNKLSGTYAAQVAALSSCKRIGLWGVGL